VGVQFVLAVHGWLVERREGMRFSRFRLFTISGLFAAATALALTTLFIHEPKPLTQNPANISQPSPPPNETQTSDNPQVKKIRQQIVEIEGEISKLDEQRKAAAQKMKELQSQLPQPPAAVAGTSPTPVEIKPPPPISRQALILGAIAITALLLLIGFVVLLAGGQIQTLLPEGWLRSRRQSENRDDMQRELEHLTSAVWRKDYTDGLAIAERIQEKRLEHFDRLDYLFLRAYCLIQLLGGENAEESAEKRRSLSEEAIKDLESVVEETPRRGEAVYLLGLAYGMADRNAEALKMFEQSGEILTRHKLPFDHNQSVCLLRLAEVSLSEGNTEQAENYFARVTNLGKLADSVVESRVKIGMINLGSAVNKKELGSAAAAAIRKLEELRALKPEHRLQIEIIHAAFSAVIALREGDAGQALAQAESFLKKHLPSDLPEPDEEMADETLGSLILERDLPFPRDVFRGFLFIQAVALCKLEARSRTMLSEAQIAKLSAPLLRGLQIDPRQRELLGALGGLYYWFRKDRRQKALDWLEAAALMGVSGRIVQKILDRDRLIEMERREALDWFRSASARFLRDPSLAGEVRSALVEELGRFQEFEPLLMSIEQRPDLEPEEPTLEVIKERARYLSQLVADISRRGQVDRQARLAQIRADYSSCLETLERTTENIASLERRVFAELGDTLSL
jgi:tetratricopeptide (TPR) repeat protein